MIFFKILILFVMSINLHAEENKIEGLYKLNNMALQENLWVNNG